MSSIRGARGGPPDGVVVVLSVVVRSVVESSVVVPVVVPSVVSPVVVPSSSGWSRPFPDATATLVPMPAMQARAQHAAVRAQLEVS
jgi:hypothetical protein